MTSIDANILLYSYSEASPHHAAAKAFLESLSPRDDAALSEFVLSEVWLHLRNPAVLDAPLSPAEAVAVIQKLPPAPALARPRLSSPQPRPPRRALESRRRSRFRPPPHLRPPHRPLSPSLRSHGFRHGECEAL